MTNTLNWTVIDGHVVIRGDGDELPIIALGATSQERMDFAARVVCSVNSYAKLPDPLAAARDDALGKCIAMLRSCRSVVPSHGTWAENNLDSIDALLATFTNP